jgi:hypothetical protein
MPVLSLVLSILDNIQHHFMAISTLDASLPALEDLFTLVHAAPLLKRSARGLLAISDAIFYPYAKLNDYGDEVEYTYISLSDRDACKM